MPGICGHFDCLSRRDDLLGRMLDAMTHFNWYRREVSVPEPGGNALGRISLGFGDSTSQPATLDETTVLAVMDGELYNTPELRSPQTPPGAIDAEILLQGYLSEGAAFLSRIRGKFTAAIWDRARGEVSLISDRFGMKPLYYSQANGRFLFASELKAILATGQVSHERDSYGIVQFFSFGHLWGQHTLYNDISLVPPGSVLRFQLGVEGLSLDRYADLPPPRTGGRPGELLEGIGEAFVSSVQETVQNTSHLGLALSGGMDARTILSVIDPASNPVKALCVGVPGSRDQASAREMANVKGCEYHEVVLDHRLLERFEDYLDQMVYLTDGHYLSQCIVMPTLERYRELGIQVLLRGHAGELMHMRKAYNFSLDTQAFELRSEVELQEWLLKHLRAYMLEACDEPLFEFATQQECEDMARRAIRESLVASESWERPVDRIWQVFVTERLRRETAMSLAKFSSVVETRLPYLSPVVLDQLARMPAEMKQDEDIQSYILRERCPEFLQITNVNTGAKVGASRASKRFHSLKMRAFAKLGLPGYQPYERLGLWLRRELKPLVKRILLSESCMQRGIFRPDTVRSVVRQHFSGRRNHTFLLMAMMIYERGQQVFVDGADVPRPIPSSV